MFGFEKRRHFLVGWMRCPPSFVCVFLHTFVFDVMLGNCIMKKKNLPTHLDTHHDRRLAAGTDTPFSAAAEGSTGGGFSPAEADESSGGALGTRRQAGMVAGLPDEGRCTCGRGGAAGCRAAASAVTRVRLVGDTVRFGRGVSVLGKGAAACVPERWSCRGGGVGAWL